MVSCGYSLGSLEGLVSGGSCEPLGSFGFCGSFWFRGSFGFCDYDDFFGFVILVILLAL